MLSSVHHPNLLFFGWISVHYAAHTIASVLQHLLVVDDLVDQWGTVGFFVLFVRDEVDTVCVASVGRLVVDDFDLVFYDDVRTFAN